MSQVPTALQAVQNGATPNPDDAAKYIEELKRLMARGSDVTLANGDVVTLVFKPRAMAAIETEYGSLNDYLTIMAQATGGPLIGTIAWTFQQLLKVDEDEAFDLIDTRHMDDYANAISAALLEALPAPDEASVKNAMAAAAAAATNQAGSPGGASSTSPSRSSTSHRRNSGKA